MASYFHTDKTTYVRDLASIRALDVSNGLNLYLSQYRQKLIAFAEIVNNPILSAKQKKKLSESLFASFDDFIAMSIQTAPNDPITLYDENTLDAAGIKVSQIHEFIDIDRILYEHDASHSVFVEEAFNTDTTTILSVAAEYKNAANNSSLVIGLIRAQSLLRLPRQASLFETIVMNEEQEILFHSGSDKADQTDNVSWLPDFKKFSQNSQLLATVSEYMYQGTSMIGGLARVADTDLVILVQIPKAVAYLTARELIRNLLLAAFALLVIGSVLSIFSAYAITIPLERLSRALAKVGKGDFDVAVDTKWKDEIGVLSSTFNKMVSELNNRERKIEEANSALLHSEKMAAIGQLSAGIAHEIKNPLTGILGHAQLAIRRLTDSDPVKEYALIIEKETKRCVKIIGKLMSFARHSEDDTVFSNIDINEISNEIIQTIQSQFIKNNIKLNVSLEENLPQISGDPDMLKQVLLNLLLNSDQALNSTGGIIDVITRNTQSNVIELLVNDNGPGIPEEIQGKIFDPFFTTKKAGEGTGLGLSITYGIITRHKGDIKLYSEPDKGCCFVITLPISDNQAQKQ
jgi:signal transduction histidine kinase